MLTLSNGIVISLCNMKGVQKVMGGLPVELNSRTVCLWQIVHERRPTPSRRREGERLWLVVVHHFEAPVGIQWHGVTWCREDTVTTGWLRTILTGV